jgi:hypothetical protein
MSKDEIKALFRFMVERAKERGTYDAKYPLEGEHMTERIITDRNGRKHITNEPLLHPPAQPASVQEPVAWRVRYHYGTDGMSKRKGDWELFGCFAPTPEKDKEVEPLYTTPPAAPVQEPVALHAMAKRRIFDAIRGAYDLGYNDARGARAVHGDSLPGYKGRDVEADHGGALFSALERYTTPPAQRTWVDLTDEEIEKACVPLGAAMLSFTEVARAIEAKLKEKNA